MFLSFEYYPYFSKVIVLFCLKYRVELNQGHTPTYEMGIFVMKAIVPEDSILDVGKSPGYTLDNCYHIFCKHWNKTNYESQQFF